MTKTMDQLVYSWKNFDHDILYLGRQLYASDWIPDYIVGVKRGGLIPAIKLSHLLNKPLIMMSCQLRDSDDTEVRLYEVEELPKDKRVLVVDDICDSGQTFQKIAQKLKDSGFSQIKSCSLFYNVSQDFAIDYKARSINRLTNNQWISFPWEKDN
jgi:hypoxanthine phosphoribosyltransferase